MLESAKDPKQLNQTEAPSMVVVLSRNRPRDVTSIVAVDPLASKVDGQSSEQKTTLMKSARQGGKFPEVALVSYVKNE